MTIIKVGMPLPGQHGLKTPKRWRYKHCTYDDEMFADATKYLPRDYDICDVKVQQEASKIFSAWHTGVGWDGHKLLSDYVVTKWRRKEEIYLNN